MRINAVTNYNCNNNTHKQNFKGLIIKKSALPVIEKMSKTDIAEFEKVKERLSKTKFWDMKISAIGDKFNEFKYSFLNKKETDKVITGGIYPYDRQGNAIKFYSIVYGPENTSLNSVEILKFESEERAKKLYDTYMQNLQDMKARNFNITPLEGLKMKEVELNILEEGSKIIEENHNLISMDTKIQTKPTIGNKLRRW